MGEGAAPGGQLSAGGALRPHFGLSEKVSQAWERASLCTWPRKVRKVRSCWSRRTRGQPGSARGGPGPATEHLQGRRGVGTSEEGRDLALQSKQLLLPPAGAAVAWHLCCCHGDDGGANLLMSPPAANNNAAVVNRAELGASLGAGRGPGTGPGAGCPPSSPCPHPPLPAPPPASTPFCGVDSPPLRTGGCRQAAGRAERGGPLPSPVLRPCAKGASAWLLFQAEVNRPHLTSGHRTPCHDVLAPRGPLRVLGLGPGLLAPHPRVGSSGHACRAST